MCVIEERGSKLILSGEGKGPAIFLKMWKGENKNDVSQGTEVWQNS